MKDKSIETEIDEQLEQIIEKQVEALLFASDTPISTHKLAMLIEAPSVKYIKTAIDSLSRFYDEHFRSFGIVEVAGGFQVTTLPEFSETVKRLYKNKRKSKLSRAALETLAIIAYKQPVSRPEIEVIRGVNCGGVLLTLTDRELIIVSGRGDGIGKPFLYSTTKRFLEYLGLKNYRELPEIEEFETEVEALDILNTKLDDKDEDIKTNNKSENANSEQGTIDNDEAEQDN
ncbi:SMC-Scp complex subunit ScpB, partial [bacterium]|nr:SMC-Scp complex subunit ScpB [bacterium]